MFCKPFRVTEYIELLGVDGVVEKIDLFSTHLRHFDKSIVVIPNKKISGEVLHNYGTIRQLDLSISVAYDSNLNATETAIRGTLVSNTRVRQDMPAAVAVVRFPPGASIHACEVAARSGCAARSRSHG